jgi:transitional endoplasmic reticulum ATPase
MSVYPNHSLVVADYINILGLPMIEVEPLYPDQMITSHLFAPLPRRAAVPGLVLQSVRFGAFRVHFEGNEFIIYIAQVSLFCAYIWHSKLTNVVSIS